MRERHNVQTDTAQSFWDFDKLDWESVLRSLLDFGFYCGIFDCPVFQLNPFGGLEETFYSALPRELYNGTIHNYLST